jgi:hypothetical protein
MLLGCRRYIAARMGGTQKRDVDPAMNIASACGRVRPGDTYREITVIFCAGHSDPFPMTRCSRRFGKSVAELQPRSFPSMMCSSAPSLTASADTAHSFSSTS